ncbi:thiamine pyrophosphate-binding protein [Candidatus Woesearchaeota archaeon]|nr:thiamine pyrophosphate-binding protein [Candidatus Woesearchaeota archaeon]
MEEMNGAEVLARSLQDLGIKHIFGYTGAAIAPVYHELGKYGIEDIQNSNEQSAAFSAAGYSRSSDKVGVAIVTSGPAITNTLTAVSDAYCDSIPMIVIAGQVPEHKLGTDSFQYIDLTSVFGGVTKRILVLSNDQDIESIIKDAYYYASSGRPGPVVIDFPLNKQQKSHPYQGRDIEHFARTYNEEHHLSPEQCRDFFDLLKKSKNPLLYIGGGLNSYDGSRAIREFNTQFNIPSVNTLMAKGVIDGRDELNLGMLGMFGTPYANMIIQENDFFFAIGVRWDDRVAEKVGFGLGSAIAYIDINPKKMNQIRMERSPEFTFRGDAATALDDLIRYAVENEVRLDIGGWQDHAKELKRTWPLDYNRDATEIQAAEVMDLLSGYIDDNTKIITGVGNHQMLAAQYLDMHGPKSFMTSGSFGTMGFGMPTSVGVHYANPGARVIVVDGDGSLRMNMGELHTIGAERRLPIKVLMLNNRADQMVQNLQDAAYGGNKVGTERNSEVNFAEVARSLNFDYAERVTNRADLPYRLREFIEAEGPCFLEVRVDHEEVLYPKVPVGKAYKDMVLGPYIRYRP